MKTLSFLFGTFVLTSAQINAQTSLTLPAACSCGPVAYTCGGSSTLVVDVINPVTGETWMDRNLGASQVATSSTDAASYGDYYQWGRACDGHQLSTSLITSTNATTAVPNAGNPWDGRFILEPSIPFNWLTPQNDNLWQGVSGTNNPCPSGYRLPTDIELNAERLSWSSNNAAGAFASPLKLPMAGFRQFNSGLNLTQGFYGEYWSSNTDGFISAYALDFIVNAASVSSNGGRGNGFSVRCIKD